MGQDKAKAQKGIAQRHLHSRISYLYQAATYLSNPVNHNRRSPKTMGLNTHPDSGAESSAESILPTQKSQQESQSPQWRNPNDGALDVKSLCASEFQHSAHSRRLLSHLRAVSLKSQIRLSPTMKHSICKRCDILLVPDSTSSSQLENKSSGGKKPWADMLVVTCNACGNTTRFPVGAERQAKRSQRPIKLKEETVKQDSNLETKMG